MTALFQFYKKAMVEHPAPWQYETEDASIRDANENLVICDGEGFWRAMSDEVGFFVVALVNHYHEENKNV